MIRVVEHAKLIFVHGVYPLRDIEQAWMEQTGKKRWNWREWMIVGMANDDSLGLQMGAPYTPPRDYGIEEVGFRYSKKNKDAQAGTGTTCEGEREEGEGVLDPKRTRRGRKA